MTFEELRKLNEVATELSDLQYGPYGLDYWNTILEKCRNHSVHGLPSISVTIDFLHETIQMPATILVEHINKKISCQKERIAELRAIMDSYQVPDACKD